MSDLFLSIAWTASARLRDYLSRMQRLDRCRIAGRDPSARILVVTACGLFELSNL